MLTDLDLADQSHLRRHLKRDMSATPAAYARDAARSRDDRNNLLETSSRYLVAWVVELPLWCRRKACDSSHPGGSTVGDAASSGDLREEDVSRFQWSSPRALGRKLLFGARLAVCGREDLAVPFKGPGEVSRGGGDAFGVGRGSAQARSEGSAPAAGPRAEIGGARRSPRRTFDTEMATRPEPRTTPHQALAA